ncbi:MAG: radical SAM protein [Lachnospiraceae bacterium]|nr:radical SAM protein [Lachnospiraceae bacterium]
MGQNKTRLTDNRNELGQKTPLKQPYVLLIDPSNLCNLRCCFCPSGNIELIKSTKRIQTMMDFKLYQKIIDDTSEFESPIKVLRLYKEGEPLINPNFADMIQYAKSSKNILRVDTTTNGILLNPELNRKIVAAGLDQINISVNGINEEQIYKYCRVKIDFKQYVQNIRDLYENRNGCEIYIKSIKENLSEEEQQKFHEIFGEISDRIFLERISPAWPGFKFDNLEMKFETGNYGQAIEDRTVCPYLFYIMVVNSDGQVTTCVGDWRHRQILGDTKKQSLKEIWYGEQMKSYWKNHLTGNKDVYEMCKCCEVIKYGCFDNIDNEAKEILKRLNTEEYLY